MVVNFRRRRSRVGIVAVGLSSDEMCAFLEKCSKTHHLAGKPAAVMSQEVQRHPHLLHQRIDIWIHVVIHRGHQGWHERAGVRHEVM